MSNKDDATEGFLGFLLILGLVILSVMVIKKFEYQTFSFWISSAFLCFVIWCVFSPKTTPLSLVKSEMRKKKIPKKAKKVIDKVGEEQPSKDSKTLIGTDLYRK
jgi:energy-coupling factor transporter transmembrane protein EcfT